MPNDLLLYRNQKDAWNRKAIPESQFAPLKNTCILSMGHVIIGQNCLDQGTLQPVCRCGGKPSPKSLESASRGKR